MNRKEAEDYWGAQQEEENSDKDDLGDIKARDTIPKAHYDRRAQA